MATKRRGQPADDALVAAVRRLAGRMGISKRVVVLLAPLPDGPATIGWLRPVILLPPATAMGITPQQLEGLLAHELAHIRRHDYLVNLGQMVVETLCFYHPAVWWVSQRIRLERELCCDDIAVLSCGDPVGYARALTALARQRMTAPAVAMAAGRGPLVTRIRRLLPAADNTRSAARWPVVLLLALIIGTGTICAAWFAPQSPTATPARSSGGKIYGYVYDPFGEPAANVSITLDNNVVEQDRGPIGPLQIFETKTDAFGYYQFEDITSGSYALTPAVAWARATTVYAPPSGSVQHDLWIAFDTMHTALFVNARQQRVAPPPPPATDDTASQPIVGPRYTGTRGFQYPDGLRLSGDVVLEGHIGTDGLPRGLRVVSAMEPELARAALAVAQQGRWEPARVRGMPLEVPIRITVVYRLTLN
jgi:TonB family protein